ncbi:V-type ATP synthase subunit D [Desulfurobacterium atlanticum]|uniref:V/A-type H+-transporting ATPase subunit D n=1 Tax=Desulfurobacterium atlanticum TaxID=240169 RepID=A0A238XR45_9BACT|nr:V-type ATP synthase subunit D [Desulfurobacterium atlanticum]SNR61455.1 V/A-type H+-transporting ATPase subunit D [Desulfurobacterium atlanticum]
MKFTKSKTQLLELKKDLNVMEEGKDILQHKRNVLIKEILKHLDRVEKAREELNIYVQKAYAMLKKAYMEEGRESVKEYVDTTALKGKIEAKEKSFIGIPVPSISYQLDLEKFPVDIVSESIFVDLARTAFIDSVKKVMELAEMEIKAWKMAEELKKTVIRVNAVEKYYIPMYEKAIKEIETALEEQELEFLSTIKKLKEKKSQSNSL